MGSHQRGAARNSQPAGWICFIAPIIFIPLGYTSHRAETRTEDCLVLGQMAALVSTSVGANPSSTRLCGVRVVVVGGWFCLHDALYNAENFCRNSLVRGFVHITLQSGSLWGCILFWKAVFINTGNIWHLEAPVVGSTIRWLGGVRG